LDLRKGCSSLGLGSGDIISVDPAAEIHVVTIVCVVRRLARMTLRARDVVPIYSTGGVNVSQKHALYTHVTQRRSASGVDDLKQSDGDGLGIGNAGQIYGNGVRSAAAGVGNVARSCGDSRAGKGDLVAGYFYGGVGSDVLVCPCVVDTSFPSILPLTSTS